MCPHISVCQSNWFLHTGACSSNRFFLSSTVTVKLLDNENLSTNAFFCLPRLRYLSERMLSAEISICNPEPGDHYLGLLGGDSCAVYDVVATEFTGECHELNHHDSGSTTEGTSTLTLDHFYYASCEPFQWVDFNLPIGLELLGSNLVYEVIDESSETNPQALGIYLYKSEIPIDRKSETYALSSSKGVYSIAVPATTLRETETHFLGVRCASESVRFKVVVMLITERLAINHAQHGEICPDSWIYFDFMSSSAIAGHHLTIRVEKFEGDLFVMARRVEPPSKLVYPYFYMAPDEYFTVFSVCSLEADDHVYIALSGGKGCAAFDVTVEVSANATCSEEKGAYHTSTNSSAVSLRHNELVYSSCTANSWCVLLCMNLSY